jgi:hypothetical protein
LQAAREHGAMALRLTKRAQSEFDRIGARRMGE